LTARSLEIIQAALVPKGCALGKLEGRGVAEEEEAEQEKPGPKGNMEGMAVGVVNFEEACEVE
jgi:hypothetical protein